MVFFFGNRFIIDEFIRLWEPEIKNNKTEHYDIAIVLGGMANYDASNDIIRFNSNVDRLLQTLPKLNRKEIDHILFSGGSGDIYHPENKEAELIQKYLPSIGINTSSFLFETESRNTYENALYSVKILKEQFGDLSKKKILLITSSAHIRRSIACFEKQGIKVDYLSTNRYSGERKFEFRHCFIPESYVFTMWEHLGHEVIGYITYKLTGKL